MAVIGGGATGVGIAVDAASRGYSVCLVEHRRPAWLAGAATNSYYRHYFDTELIFSLITPRILLFSMCLSLGLGLAAGAVAAWRLVRTPPMVLWGRA